MESDPAEGLGALIEAAASAEPDERIAFRDPIVAMGHQAVAPVAAWVEDPRLGAFAVRVLERLARQPDASKEAIGALESALERAATPSIRRDAEDALGRLGRATVTPMRRRRPHASIGRASRGSTRSARARVLGDPYVGARSRSRTQAAGIHLGGAPERSPPTGLGLGRDAGSPDDPAPSRSWRGAHGRAEVGLAGAPHAHVARRRHPRR